MLRLLLLLLLLLKSSNQDTVVADKVLKIRRQKKCSVSKRILGFFG
jgi:hypothetical protein